MRTTSRCCHCSQEDAQQRSSVEPDSFGLPGTLQHSPQLRQHTAEASAAAAGSCLQPSGAPRRVPPEVHAPFCEARAAHIVLRSHSCAGGLASAWQFST